MPLSKSVQEKVLSDLVGQEALETIESFLVRRAVCGLHVFAGFEIVSELLKSLEAAIGIEPMNKGFAVLRILFSQVLVDADKYALFSVFDIPRLYLFTQIRRCFAW
jgi:hypothetical protein